VNRVLAGVDYSIQRYIVAPIARLYRFFTPPQFRKHLALAGENIQYPGRVINNLLQAKWKEAGTETKRFAVNTTVGVLGLYDPASKMGLHPQVEDFGQTFAKWGWKNSTYVYIPFIGPSTFRDAIGKVPDYYVDPASLHPELGVAREFNENSDEVERNLRLVQANYDAYEPVRTLWALSRTVDVTNFEWKSDESGPTQTLDTIFLQPQDPTFPDIGLTSRAHVAKDRDLPFTLYLQPKPAPILYLVPGMGGHRLGESCLALAEIAYRLGNSVVAVSNPTNWEFSEHGSSVDQPGYAPADARDLHRAITAIDALLETRMPGRFTQRRLAGISMGAFQVLYIAADEPNHAANGVLSFEIYLALNAPVNLEHSMLQLDRFYNAPLSFPPEERKRRIDEIFGKVIYLSNGELWPDMELPFTQLEAEYLIGLAYRLELQYMIVQSQQRHDMGVLQTPSWFLRRAPAYREASEYSFMEYVYAFLLPYYAQHDPRITFDDAGARAMLDACDLRSIEKELEHNERVVVVSNENDFLLRPEDVTWLREHLGDRAHLFPAGGHLGNLHRKAIQEAIEGIVAERIEGTSPAQE